MQNKIFTLNKEQEGILQSLALSPLKKKFYWTGGTALAFFYLHHRCSYDIDLFTREIFTYREIIPFVKELAKKQNIKKIEEKKVFDRWEFFLHNHHEMRLEFAQYDFPRLKPMQRWKDISVDSLEDMAANKAMALLDRHEPKDAFDIYFILKKQKIRPITLLQWVNKKFGVQFTLSTFLAQALQASQDLHAIRPILFGNQGKQKKQIQDTLLYFQKLSAHLLHRAIR